MLYKRLSSVVILTVSGLIFCLMFAGCGGGSSSNEPASQWSDDFQSLGSDKWMVNAAVSTVDGKLVLKSTPDAAAEVQSQSDYLYKSVQFTAVSDNWATGTSLGFDISIGGLRQAIIVTQGKLGVINKSKPGVNESYTSITGWDALSGNENILLIKWSSAKVELYINGTLAAQYEGTLIPAAAMNVYIAANGTVTDRLVVDQVKISDGAAVIIEDNLDELDTAEWTVSQGSLATTDNGMLILRSTDQQAAEVQSKSAFLLKELEVRAESSDWDPGTSIGYELTDPAEHYGIVVNNGQLQVANPSGQDNEAIPGWISLSNQMNVYNLKWNQTFVHLLINGILSEVYSGSHTPDKAAKVRFNAGGSSADELRIDYVRVRNRL